MDPILASKASTIAATYGQLGVTMPMAYRIAEVARTVGGEPLHLAEVINAESRFNPQAVNPTSGATGLIQFMPKTAAALGFTTQQIYNMGFDDQMLLVEAYLNKVAMGTWAGGGVGPLDTRAKMALAVFYPALRNAAPDTPLPANVSAANAPGGVPLQTVGDYVDFVLAQARRAAPTPAGMRRAARIAAPAAIGGAITGGSLVVWGVGIGLVMAYFASSRR